MKSNLFLKVVMIWISFWSFVPGAMGQADERLAAVMKLSQQGKPKEALAAGQKYLKELRDTLPEADHPAIGMAASTVGMAASAAGEHEEAVRLLKEGIPIIKKMRAGQLFADELPMSEALLASLEAMKRTDEAMAVLGDLLERTRKQLAQRANGGGLKLDQPGGPAVALDAILMNEDVLATLLERSGMLQLKLKRWEEAEKDLKEVEQILKRIHPDEQQARLVKLREGWEEAARKQGKAIRPHLVGRFSMPRTIQIQGNAEISTEQIHTALTRSSVYVMASHPGAEFDAYLQKLQRCLELGYQANGFPNATVTVDWDGTKDAVSARIVEGPRFKTGGIRIQGAKALTVEKLLESLILVPDAVEKPVSRAEESYKKIIAKKGLQGEQKGKGIMEAKIQGEDAVRELYANPDLLTRKIGYTVVRPGGLTTGESLGVTALELNQGDSKSGRLSRADVAAICVQCLDSSDAFDTTFECYETLTAKPVESVGLSNLLKSKDPTIFVSGKERRGETWSSLFAGLERDTGHSLIG